MLGKTRREKNETKVIKMEGKMQERKTERHERREGETKGKGE